jgi:hypothetical protein
MSFRTLRNLLAAVAASLCLAAPAYAQQGTLVVPDEAPVCTGVGATTTACTTDGSDPAAEPTVGEGQVITDPAAEIEDVDASVQSAPKRGSMEIEGGTSASSSAEPVSAGAAPVADTAAVAPADAAPAQVTTAASAPAAKTLPFTGVDSGPLALIGALMLLAGIALSRATSRSAA